MLKLAHIVNPLVVRNPASDLNVAQPITLRTMLDAQAVANRSGVSESTQPVNVDLYSCAYEEDAQAIPDGFINTPWLERSILDVVPNCEKPRQLPLLADILERLYHSAEDADYLIYSNIDIGVWPEFYLQVEALIRSGLEAFAIGRRTLSTEFTQIEDLEQILAQEGEPHFGFSCFVFPRAHFPAYQLHETCIGLQPIGVTLAVNMIQQASTYEFYSHEKMTFHLGDDRIWDTTLLDAQHIHNEQTLDDIVAQLRQSSPLKPRAQDLLNNYQRWRCRYVIDKTPKSVRRNIYRTLRKLGRHKWVGNKYKLYG